MKGNQLTGTDLIFIDGNEADLKECQDEDELMKRVWRLSKPPTDFKLNEPTISAVRIYHQNLVIRAPEAWVPRSTPDKTTTKPDKTREVKDLCGCCEACLPRHQEPPGK